MSRIVTLFLLVLLVFPSAGQDAATFGPATVSAEVLAELPLVSAPARTSAHLAPDGERLLHIDDKTFCLYTFLGEPLGCSDMVEQLGEAADSVAIDSETVSWSPDGQYVAFGTDAWIRLRDPDVWVFDVAAGEFLNITDDGYDGRIMFGDDIPDTAFVDVVPAWLPDGRLTFARHTAENIEETRPTLWAVTPGDWQAEQMAEFDTVPGYFSIVYAMEWSPDGSTLAYVIDSPRNPFAGVWLYDMAEDRHRPLIYLTEGIPGFMRASFSPDGQYLLVLDSRRDQFRGAGNRPDLITGYTVVEIETGKAHQIRSDAFVVSAGWLPDGGLIYTALDLPTATHGLYVRDPLGGEESARRILDAPAQEDGPPLPIFASTNRQIAPLYVNPDGRLLLATPAELTLAIQLETD